MLTGAERRTLREAVIAAFDYEGLKQALFEASYSRDVGDLVSPEASFDDRVTQLITRSIKEGWVQELLQTLLDARRQKKEFVDAVAPIAERARSLPRKIVGNARHRGPWVVAAAGITAFVVFWFAFPDQRDSLRSKFSSISCDKPESVFGNFTPVWNPTEATNFDLVLPVSTFKQPHTACGLAEALNLDAFKSKLETGAFISEATIRDVDWHRIETKGQEPIYVLKSDIPAWIEAHDVEIVQPVDARNSPIKTATVKILQPDEFRRLARHQSLRKATIAGETWYRLSTPGETSELFFPESGNGSRIVEWRRIAGCAVTKQLGQGFVRTWRSPLGSDAIDQLPPNTRIGPIVQESKDGTQARLRFGRGSADFKYIDRNEVDVLDAAKCTT
jgi:hypothetical protein